MKCFKVYFCLIIVALFLIVVKHFNKPLETLNSTSELTVRPFVAINQKKSLNNKSKKLELIKYTHPTNKSSDNSLFNIKDKHNFQGITFFKNHFYCGFDVGNGHGKIVKYDRFGEEIFETKSMVVGHCADLGYRTKTNNIYIANGGGHNLARVYVVDYTKSSILSTLNYNSLGTSALLAIDNVHDYLILHTVINRGDNGNPTFTIINLANMHVINTFNISTKGTPQGLETDGKNIYLYTNNKITVLDYKGSIITTYYIHKTGESEGITIALENEIPFLAIGYNSPNRIYALRGLKRFPFHNIKVLNNKNTKPHRNKLHA
ncbi:YncE family protein [Clostridium psychrophilum]|uniref:YncE family protein n=1 Tax=Clostridium psychrophilum TaxID=132926 RepID=UPI001C0AA690|nr:hypothetical protein [Clostridium psychrophilum]MBU3179644.1 hypothetical protein [Clostridium psychrophilum]